MKKVLTLAFAGALAAACGHAQPTGSARNNWATPTGYATATNPNYINPDAAAHPARNRNAFRAQLAPDAVPRPAVAPAPPSETLPPPTEAPPPPPEPIEP
jgi:hypothetical protein